jgi:4-amino-4-deoxy-L-arabinose transferase-like glycosyltransferase
MNKIKACDWLLVIICLSLLYVGIQTTANSQWPYDRDHFRDIALTQTIIDNGYGCDPYYSGQYVWYNPGLHFILSGLSLLLGIPVPLLVTKIGTYLNLLPLIAFYIMLRFMLGPIRALAATLVYLFTGNSAFPMWFSAIYSPALYTIIFTQTLFYITLTHFYRTIRTKDTPVHYLVSGALLGLTFLFHTAPALIAGVIIGTILLWETIAGVKAGAAIAEQSKELIKKYSAILISAIPISFVFLYFPFKYYNMKVLNVMPISWINSLFAVEELPELLQIELLQIALIITVLGVVFYFKKDSENKLKKIFIVWFTFVFGAMVIYFLNLLPNLLGTPWRLPVSVHHFFFYFKVLRHIFLAIGIVALTQIIFDYIKRKSAGIDNFSLKFNGSNKIKTSAFILGIVLLIGSVIVVYPEGSSIKEVRDYLTKKPMYPHYIKAYHWIRKNTDNQDVFLCSKGLDITVVPPTGRKVVSTYPYFSNPYVNFKQRDRHRKKLFASMERGNAVPFKRLCKKYKIRYIILDRFIYRKKIHPHILRFLKKEFANATLEIFKVNF